MCMCFSCGRASKYGIVYIFIQREHWASESYRCSASPLLSHIGSKTGGLSRSYMAHLERMQDLGDNSFDAKTQSPSTAVGCKEYIIYIFIIYISFVLFSSRTPRPRSVVRL